MFRSLLTYVTPGSARSFFQSTGLGVFVGSTKVKMMRAFQIRDTRDLRNISQTKERAAIQPIQIEEE